MTVNLPYALLRHSLYLLLSYKTTDSHQWVFSSQNNEAWLSDSLTSLDEAKLSLFSKFGSISSCFRSLSSEIVRDLSSNQRSEVNFSKDPHCERSLSSLFKEFDYSLYQKARISCFLTTILCNIITTNLPLLRFLTLEVSEIGENVFVFPLSMSNLMYLRLKIDSLSSPKEVDLTILNKLERLSVTSNFILNISGIVVLKNLKFLELISINDFDSLHPDADLHRLTVSLVPSESIAKLFTNKNCLKNCQVCIQNCELNSISSFLYDCNLFAVHQTSLENSKSLSCCNLKYLQEISVDSRMFVSNMFSECTKLQRLAIQGPSEVPSSLNFFPFKFLRRLTLSKVNIELVTKLLEVCEFLLYLEIKSLQSRGKPLVVSKYLVYLRLFDVTNVFSFLHPLPRLKTMSLSMVTDVNLPMFNTHFSALQRLELDDCEYVGRLETVNYSIQQLFVKHVYQQFEMKPNTFELLSSVEHFSFTYQYTGYLLPFSFKTILLPPNLKSFYCSAPWRWFKDAISRSSLIVLVGEMDLEVVDPPGAPQKWLNDLKNSHPRMTVNVSFINN
ncbi:hypothetical protein RCL1_008870 [Eukaryota sp. TZLM3-RCL]